MHQKPPTSICCYRQLSCSSCYPLSDQTHLWSRRCSFFKTSSKFHSQRCLCAPRLYVYTCLIMFNAILISLVDLSCILIPPQRPSSTVSASLKTKIVVSLATQFNVHVLVVRCHFNPDNVVQWAKVCHLSGGDDMLASELASYAEDRRDATFIWVS